MEGEASDRPNAQGVMSIQNIQEHTNANCYPSEEKREKKLVGKLKQSYK